MFNKFIETFQQILKTGITNITPSLIFILTILAIIDFTYTLTLEFGSDIKKLIPLVIRKVLRLGLSVLIIKSLSKIIEVSLKVAFGIGYTFWENGGSKTQLPDIDNIWEQLYTSIKVMFGSLLNKRPLVEKMVIVLLLCVLAYVIFKVLKEIFLSYVTVLATGTISAFLLVFQVIDVLQSYTQSYYKAFVKCLLRLAIAIGITGVYLQLVKLVTTFSQKSALEDLIGYVIGTTIIALLITQAYVLASLVMDGTGNFGMGLGGVAVAMVGSAVTGGIPGMIAMTGGVMGATRGMKAAIKNKTGLKGVASAFMGGFKTGTVNAANSKFMKNYKKTVDKASALFTGNLKKYANIKMGEWSDYVDRNKEKGTNTNTTDNQTPQSNSEIKETINNMEQDIKAETPRHSQPFETVKTDVDKMVNNFYKTQKKQKEAVENVMVNKTNSTDKDKVDILWEKLKL